MLLDHAEELAVVSNGQCRRAVWRAAIRLANARLVDIDDTIFVPLYDDALVSYDFAVAIKRDDICYTECLAGYDEQLATLDRNVRDRRIANDNIGGGANLRTAKEFTHQKALIGM